MKKLIIIFASAMVMLAFGTGVVFGESFDRCPNCGESSPDRWNLLYTQRPNCSDSGYECWYCDSCHTSSYKTIPATGRHIWHFVSVNNYPSCVTDGSEIWICSNCRKVEYRAIPSLGSHHWGDLKGTTWYYTSDGDDDSNDTEYEYGRMCDNCNYFEYVPKTVKKGKTKRIIPKKFFKGAYKKRVAYNKNKVKAYKDGRVKGKKKGAVAEVTWYFYFKEKHTYKWHKWYEKYRESYTVYIQVK